MADRTTTFAVDNTQDYNVVAQTPCRRIVVQENYNSANPPTADLLQKQPATAVAAINIAQGTPAIYTAPSYVSLTNLGSGVGMFTPGQVVGTIRTTAGAITVQQIESDQV